MHMRSISRLSLLLPVIFLLTALPLAAMEVIEDHQDMAGPFPDGPSVTAACLECHEDEAHDFMKTSHWTWLPMQTVMGQEEIALGKRNTMNNFCVGLSSNWARCTSCHAGYGWVDDGFDFSDPANIDCLVCHDQTGLYRKFPTGAGHPTYDYQEWEGIIWEPLDLAGIARTVGPASRQTCGSCHFYGGMGNNVKHGDMDKALVTPARELDVHMSREGQNFDCIACHDATDHLIAGNSMYDSPSGTNHLDCSSCHGDAPHPKRILNWHGKSIACQTCHIPTIARVNPTLTWWDWSTAGTGADNAKDQYGMDTFDNAKGTFRWEKNLMPTFRWYNGTSSHYLVGSAMNPTEVTHLNKPQGTRLDPKAKIHPFKVMRGKQAYDKKNRVLVITNLYGPEGLWENGYDWNAANKQGMEAAGLDYSGEYGFAETESWWKINHMVAPKEQALKCVACHDSAKGRLDWQALGYQGDPSLKRGVSRFELKDAYRDVNQD
jgi:octaheme c-type cytochrome (tetrathionate reductase family)